MKPISILLLTIGATLVGAFLQQQHHHTEDQRPSLEMEVVSNLDFDATVEKIKATATAEKYGVQGVHPLSEILTEKGFPRERLTIVEVCNPASATNSLNNDIRSGLHMPCPIMVYQKGSEVRVMTFDTRTMATMYGGKTMNETGASVYAALRKILDSVDASKGN